MTNQPRPGLRQAREHLGISQRELGQRLGIDPRVIGFYESGRREPSVGTALAIARELHVSVERAFNASDRPPGAGREAPEETKPGSTRESTDA